MRTMESNHWLADFETWLEAQRSEWKIPGLAIGVIKDGEVVLCKGYGERDLESHLPVTPETVFPIGSATKAFTSLAMGILVDEGKVNWDQPVRTYLPSLQLSDPYITEHVTLCDLLTHRTGLPRHEFFWMRSPHSRRELIERMRYLHFHKEFRTTFWYQNLTYMIAGEVIAEATGSSWEEFVEQRILRPLGMAATSVTLESLLSVSNVARGYAEKDDQLQVLPYENLNALGPAGSINSNLSDMLKWLMLHVNPGKNDPLVSEATQSKLYFPQVVVPDPVKYPETSHMCYALGWRVMTYHGHTMIRHGGNVSGFSSQVTFLPHERLGVVILSNKNQNPMLTNILYYLYDHLLDLEPINWNARLCQQSAQTKQSTEERKQKSLANRKADTTPSHPVCDYAGVYRHPGYGDVVVELEGEGLKITYNSFTFPLTHYHYDIFEYVFEMFDMPFKVSFFTGLKGEIQRLSIPFEGVAKEIAFTRV